MRFAAKGVSLALLLGVACGEASRPAPSFPAAVPSAIAPKATATSGGGLGASAPRAPRSTHPAEPPEVAEPYAANLARYQNATYEKLEKELGLESRRDPALGFEPTQVEYFDRISGELMLTKEELAVYRREGMVSARPSAALQHGERLLRDLRAICPF